MESNIVAGIAGVALSLIFGYVPGARSWFEALDGVRNGCSGPSGGSGGGSSSGGGGSSSGGGGPPGPVESAPAYVRLRSASGISSLATAAPSTAEPAVGR